MRHDPHSAPDVPIDPNARYETRDVTISTLLPWLFGLFVFMGVSAVAGYGVYVLYVPRIAERTNQYPLPVMRALPAAPVIQANPAEDIKIFRRNEDVALHSYGRDPVTNDLHIPVGRALDLVAQEGLPTRAHPGTMEPDLPNEPSRADGQAPPEQATENQSPSRLRGGVDVNTSAPMQSTVNQSMGGMQQSPGGSTGPAR